MNVSAFVSSLSSFEIPKSPSLTRPFFIRILLWYEISNKVIFKYFLKNFFKK